MKVSALTHPAVYQAAGQLPPGTGQLSIILAWVTGICGLLLMGGFVASMGKTGMASLRHGSFEGGMGAVVCLVCAVFLGAASAIFAALGISS